MRRFGALFVAALGVGIAALAFAVYMTEEHDAKEAAQPSASPVLVSTASGTVRGVGIGSSQKEIERVFGPHLGGGGYFPVDAEPSQRTGPQSIPQSGAYSGPLKYRGFAFLIGDYGVYSLKVTAPGARTEAGVGVGDSLDAVRAAYPRAECGVYDYGDYGGYQWCRTRVRGNSVFFGGDPVTSITLTRIPIPGCRPSDYRELPGDAYACSMGHRGG